jgi:hypothetical protein
VPLGIPVINGERAVASLAFTRLFHFDPEGWPLH